MEDNLSYMDDFSKLSPKEQEAVEKVRSIIENTPQIACTNCCYCIKGCPQNIQVNRILSNINFYDKFNDMNGAKRQYNEIIRDKSGRATDCINCKLCEGVCPQHIKITEHLERAGKLFEE